MSPRRSQLVFAALLGLAVGVSGETLLFLQRQARVVEQALEQDFRVLLFLRADADDGKLKVLAEQLRALPDVDDVRPVGRQEQLSDLRRDDPELVESVMLVGDNPLTPAFEVRLAEGGIGRVTEWLTRAQSVADFADARYKPAEVQAILQARFYARFIDLALAAAVCALAALVLAGLWAARRAKSLWTRQSGWPAAASAVAAAVAAALVAALLLPMRGLSAWWDFPGALAQALLVAAAAGAGWALCARPE